MGLFAGVGEAVDGLASEVDKAVQEASEGDLAGLADHMAGSVDESIARQFDNKPGGGFADMWVGTSGNPGLAATTDENLSDLFPESMESAGEAAQAEAGRAHASIARQFDGTPGGGFADLDTVLGGMADNPAVSAALLFVAVLAVSYVLGQLFEVHIGN